MYEIINAGDTTNTGLYAGILIVAAIIIIGALVVYLRRKNKK